MIQQNSRIFEQVQAPIMRPIHSRGTLWVGAAVLLAVISMLAGWDLTALLWLIAGVFYVCFRNPQRVMPVADSIAVAPADGILTRIDRIQWPAEAAEDGEATRLIISPRFYDAHILRAPVAAVITTAQHILGQWGSNVFEKNEPGNERMSYVLKLADGRTVMVEIIAGGFAERIQPSVRAGDTLSLGQEIGYSAFGGQVHVYLPDGVEVIAQPGQHMVAGETAIAALDAAAAYHDASDSISNDDTDYAMSSNDTGVLPNSAGFKF